jgi:hypothetical protein
MWLRIALIFFSWFVGSIVVGIFLGKVISLRPKSRAAKDEPDSQTLVSPPDLTASNPGLPLEGARAPVTRTAKPEPGTKPKKLAS